MNGVISGIISGAVAGLVVSAILAAYTLVSADLRRKEQVGHIREMIASERSEIYSMPERIDPLPSGTELSPNDFRYAIFRGFRTELELALKDRSPEITFDERRKILRVFAVHDLIINSAPEKVPDLGFYNNIFGQWEEIDWLKLPKREPEAP